MAAGSEDLILKVSADTRDVATGLAPMSKALDKLAHDADDAADELRQLDNVDVKLSIRDEAITKARADIDRLRNEIAHGITMGLDTRGAQRELSQLQTAVRKLADKPERVEMKIDVDREALATTIEGVDSLREGALGLGEAVGALDGSMGGFAQVSREMVPALADLNQTMAAMRLRNEAMGRSFGRLGTAVSSVTGVMAGPWGLAIAAGAGLLASFADASDTAEDEARQFSEAIDFQAGAMSRANRELVANRLNSGDALKEAERLGVATTDLVDALLSGGDASKAMRDRLQRMFDNAPAFSKTANDAKDLLAWYESINNELVTGEAIQARAARAIGNIGEETETTTEALDAQLSIWDLYEQAVDDSRQALDDIVSSLDILNGRFVDAQEAQANYEEGVDNLNEAIKNGTKSMDLSKEAGRDNDRMVREQAKNIDELARARIRDMETSGESMEQILADYGAQRTSLQGVADKLGLSETAAKKYIDKLLATPKKLKTEVEQEGAEEAAREIDEAAKDRDTAINVGVNINVDKISQDIARGIRSGFGAGIPNISVQSAPRAAPAAGLTLLQPRLYLDSRPIRAALRNDVTSTVAAQLAATRTRGRL